MEKIKIVASTKVGYEAPKEEFDKLGGLTAGVCYLPDTTDKLFSEPQEKTERRAEMIKASGHHSPFDHSTFTMELVGIPKIIAMTINNEKLYTTSEKSARYKVMTDVPPKEKELYDKWLEIFKGEIANKYQASNPNYFTDTKITKLAQENARYLTSVFTPTTMEYTCTYRQFNILYSLIKKEIEDINDFVFGNNLSNQTMTFFIKYQKSLQELASKFEELPYLDSNLFDKKGRKLSLIDKNYNRPIVKQYGDVYKVGYYGSFAQLAQAHRHRTINYNFMLAGSLVYIPPIIKDNENLVKMWQKDYRSIADTFPQGRLVFISETGTLDNLILKAKERKCACAQLEIDNQTTDTIMEIYDHLVDERHPGARDLEPYTKKSSRCTFPDYTCPTPCGFKEGIKGERLI